MPSPHSLRRLANLTKQVRNDLRRGGMAVNFKYLFRSTAILARIVEVLADHVATQAEEEQEALERALSEAEAEAIAELDEAEAAPEAPASAPEPMPPTPRRTRETVDG
ncbi:MAG: hypothetical protein QNJ98_16215 [Planctomycetota bacterium]|nr:hypothetical protein [Planctomycetota bacterium]